MKGVKSIMTTKIISRRKPELHGHKVKRTGATYYEAWYWNGRNWDYKEFNVRKEATEFVKQYN